MPSKRLTQEPKLKSPVPRPGRRVKLDPKVVEGMASVGATTCEIADFLGVSEAVIRKRCGPVLTKARASLKTRLRQAQLKAALAGNPAMLIWLGKQMLGQVEKIEHSGPAGGPIAVRVTHTIVDPAIP